MSIYDLIAQGGKVADIGGALGRGVKLADMFRENRIGNATEQDQIEAIRLKNLQMENGGVDFETGTTPLIATKGNQQVLIQMGNNGKAYSNGVEVDPSQFDSITSPTSAFNQSNFAGNEGLKHNLSNQEALYKAILSGDIEKAKSMIGLYADQAPNEISDYNPTFTKPSISQPQDSGNKPLYANTPTSALTQQEAIERDYQSYLAMGNDPKDYSPPKYITMDGNFTKEDIDKAKSDFNKPFESKTDLKIKEADTIANNEIARKAKVELPKIINSSTQLINNIDQVLSYTDEDMENTVGIMGRLPSWPGSVANEIDSIIEQIRDGGFLDIYQNSLKGGGQITEIEGTKGTNAYLGVEKQPSVALKIQKLKEARYYSKRSQEAAKLNSEGIIGNEAQKIIDTKYPTKTFKDVEEIAFKLKQDPLKVKKQLEQLGVLIKNGNN